MIGATVGFNAPPEFFGSADVAETIAEIADLGIEWVVLTPTDMQESTSSPRMFRDFEHSPSDIDLAETIDRMHDAGLKVQLRPMIECYDGHGRNQIWFPPDDSTRMPGRESTYYARWFRAMRARTRHYARVAERTACEMYGLESEVDRFVDHGTSWREVVDVARSVYTGPVTSCHTHLVDFEQQLSDPDHWFRDLDLLQTSFYFSSRAAAGSISVDDRIEHLQEPLLQYRRIAALLGKPFMFGECGCTSARNGSIRPWDVVVDDAYDGAEQADHLEAIIRTFDPEEWWAGLFWWKWIEHSDRPQFRNDPAGDKGFTISGKPAAGVLGEYARRYSGGAAR